ncbi:hypothetical protein ANN_22535 [Periplaneta americana]|uniref:Uncharacterized protein n=1 Tax=Periplaneta americana TaxID=6978 RepID=A0ABQ8S8R3_PERAM|nr:hypothetical protein ANN_22535 [Periplaneta americana]
MHQAERCICSPEKPFFLEDIRHNLLLPATRPYNEVIARRKQEREMDSNFFGGDTMVNREPGVDQQQPEAEAHNHQAAIYGYHHQMCTEDKYHHINEQCVCKMCNQKCELYHFSKCKKMSQTLNELIKPNV